MGVSGVNLLLLNLLLVRVLAMLGKDLLNFLLV